MKRKITALAAAAMLALCGCARQQGGTEGTSSAETADSSAQAETSAGSLAVTAAEGMDPDYQALVTRYFTALDQNDYAAYKETVYPPYLEQYTAFLEQNGSDPETAFHEMHERFDEDGYEGWHFTELQLAYYPEEKLDLDGFFQAYARAGFYGDEFIEATKKDASEIKDVQFTLYALYTGDDAAVPVVEGGEMLVLKNSEGCYLFG